MLDSIPNIRLRDSHKLTQEEAGFCGKALPYLKPKDHLGLRKARNLSEMQFAEVTNIRQWLSKEEGVPKAVALYFDCPEKGVYDYRLLDFWPAFNYLTRQIKVIDNQEKVRWSRPLGKHYQNVGMENLNIFGPLNILDTLAQRYGKSPLEVETWPYGLVHTLVWRNAVNADIQEMVNENIKR